MKLAYFHFIEEKGGFTYLNCFFYLLVLVVFLNSKHGQMVDKECDIPDKLSKETTAMQILNGFSYAVCNLYFSITLGEQSLTAQNINGIQTVPFADGENLKPLAPTQTRTKSHSRRSRIQFRIG